MRVFVPGDVLKHSHSQEVIARAMHLLRCQSPKCNGGFNKYSEVCVVMNPEQKENLVHAVDECITEAVRDGCKMCEDNSNKPLLNALFPPTEKNPSSVAPDPSFKFEPEHGQRGRELRRFVRRSMARQVH